MEEVVEVLEEAAEDSSEESDEDDSSEEGDDDSSEEKGLHVPVGLRVCKTCAMDL